MISFEQFFNESFDSKVIRDPDTWDQALSDWWEYIQASTEGIPQHITKLAKGEKSHFTVTGPTMEIRFYPTQKLDIQSGEQKGSDYVAMIEARIGGYPDSGYIIQDIDVDLVKQWWKDWLEDNEGHYA